MECKKNKKQKAYYKSKYLKIWMLKAAALYKESNNRFHKDIVLVVGLFNLKETMNNFE